LIIISNDNGFNEAMKIDKLKFIIELNDVKEKKHQNDYNFNLNDFYEQNLSIIEALKKFTEHMDKMIGQFAIKQQHMQEQLQHQTQQLMQKQIQQQIPQQMQQMPQQMQQMQQMPQQMQQMQQMQFHQQHLQFQQPNLMSANFQRMQGPSNNPPSSTIIAKSSGWSIFNFFGKSSPSNTPPNSSPNY